MQQWAMIIGGLLLWAYLAAWVFVDETTEAHCLEWGVEHGGTDWRLRGYCDVLPGVRVPAQGVGGE